MYVCLRTCVYVCVCACVCVSVVCVCVYVCVCTCGLCVCVCVCVRERDRENFFGCCMSLHVCTHQCMRIMMMLTPELIKMFAASKFLVLLLYSMLMYQKAIPVVLYLHTKMHLSHSLFKDLNLYIFLQCKYQGFLTRMVYLKHDI